MNLLSDSQLNSLNKEALIIIVSSLQDQIKSMHDQLYETPTVLVTYISSLTSQMAAFYSF